MDICDDGSDLAPDWQGADNNLYGVLRGHVDPSAVAERFVRVGWQSRSSSRDSYEVETRWCRIELDADGADTLLSGVVDPDKLDSLALLLSQFGLSFGLELYADGGGLLREITV